MNLSHCSMTPIALKCDEDCSKKNYAFSKTNRLLQAKKNKRSDLNSREENLLMFEKRKKQLKTKLNESINIKNDSKSKNISEKNKIYPHNVRKKHKRNNSCSLKPYRKRELSPPLSLRFDVLLNVI